VRIEANEVFFNRIAAMKNSSRLFSCGLWIFALALALLSLGCAV